MIAALWDWADANTSATVIWSHQDGPTPALPYFTLNVIASSREGLPHIGDPDASGAVVIHQGQLFTLSVQAYGVDVTDEIQTLRDSLERITVQQSLRSSGFAYVRVLSEPTELPQVVGTVWQQRAQMDVQFRAARDIEDDVGLIETVALSGGDGIATDDADTIGGA